MFSKMFGYFIVLVIFYGIIAVLAPLISDLFCSSPLSIDADKGTVFVFLPIGTSYFPQDVWLNSAPLSELSSVSFVVSYSPFSEAVCFGSCWNTFTGGLCT